jgi:arginine:agmatine antiporter
VSGENALAVLPRATVMVFWAFSGIEGAIIIAVRVRNPARDVPIGTLCGVAIAAVIYIATSAAIMGMLPAAVLAKSSAPFADAVAPVLGASVAGAVALCAILKASGTLGTTLLLTVETAESKAVLGRMRKTAPAHPVHRASLGNLIFTGALTSLVVIVSASPTLARQFTIVTNVAVVLTVTAYFAASLALYRLARSLPQRRRSLARFIGVLGALFSVLLIAASERDLLVWSAGAVVLALIGYWLIQLRALNRARLLAEA